ncbi:MAG: hypothetical protein AAFN93_14775 [Bacteroidota bacterium]
MKTYTNLSESNELLSNYIGATAQIYVFSITHKRLAIRLKLPKKDEVLYLVAVGCKRINGDFYWKDANLSIVELISDGEDTTKIIDNSGDFELISLGGFSILQGREEEFGTSFDNFILDKSDLAK